MGILTCPTFYYDNVAGVKLHVYIFLLSLICPPSLPPRIMAVIRYYSSLDN